ncbi:MAG: hypothetical protein A2W86_11835 [Bacteroidetes bacterium GWD2_45_23]|nr:MAG: hypothetical protein A2W87_08180 [Bacteroidetes bacterium GWC2_46_850]OFX70132.1 MAG: hypothetical protein A2071_04610 [Bacteroidetes bacterium GWC1_47_7]OFX85511.1 MAG: hypothetical protein A2W86_11835 [Bacteroidetes bacterium GWD2_45_23]HBB00737.1 hypothetical protein [Porphyromonadaceae bacterium]HCC19362.1 hypothetical protein [Porphyromonadaceae bacterium]
MIFILISCKKNVMIDGVTFTKITGERNLYYLVSTSRTVEDESILIKSVKLLGLENCQTISFMNQSNFSYAELYKVDNNYAYKKFEKPSSGSKSSVSSFIYDGNKCAIISEDFVKSKLKFPLESKIKTSTHVHEVEGDQAIVINKFTTKNAFGVTSEYVYKIWMNFNGGDWKDIKNWSYSKLIIENTATGEKQIFKN